MTLRLLISNASMQVRLVRVLCFLFTAASAALAIGATPAANPVEQQVADLVQELVTAKTREFTAKAEQQLSARPEFDVAPMQETATRLLKWDPDFARLFCETMKAGYEKYAKSAQAIAAREVDERKKLQDTWIDTRRELELRTIAETQLNDQAAVRKTVQALLNFDNRWLWFSGTCGMFALFTVTMWARRHELRRLMWTRRSQFWLIGVMLIGLVVAFLVPTVLSFTMPAAKVITADSGPEQTAGEATNPLAKLQAEVNQAKSLVADLKSQTSVGQPPASTPSLGTNHPGAVDLNKAVAFARQVEHQRDQAALAAAVSADLAAALQNDLKALEEKRTAHESAVTLDRNSRMIQQYSGAITGGLLTMVCGLFGMTLWLREKRKQSQIEKTCPKCLAVGKLRPADDSQRLGLRKLECTNVIVEDPFEDCRFSFNEGDAAVQKLGFSTLGVAQSGKTLSLVMLYRTLRRGAAGATGQFERISSVGAEKFDGFMDQVLNSRIGLGATRVDAIPEPVMFRMADRDRLGSTQIMASLFDYAGAITIAALGGNSWNPAADFHRKRALDSDGFFFFIDPTEHADKQIEALDMFRDDLRLVKGLKLGQQMTRPVALCVSKIDLLVNQPQCAGAIDFFYEELRKIDHECPGFSLRAIERRSQLMQDYRKLIWPGWEIEQSISDLFGGRYMFFPQTPVGLQQNELGNEELSQRTFDPKYILEPLLWLLHMNGYQVLDP